MKRETKLKAWLDEIFNTEHFEYHPLTGDASFRRYFRIKFANNTINKNTMKSLIVMDAPPPEEPERFVTIAKILAQQGLSVPNIIHQDLKQGFLVLSDFGDAIYLNALTNKQCSPDNLYKDALHALSQMQHCHTTNLPIFDRNLFNEQLNLFSDWYLKKHLNITLNTTLEKMLLNIYPFLFDVFDKQPKVFVHRDYHSRNLMILPDKSPGILDFQDAIIGPITYDLVSLFQDCYISWPPEKIVEWSFYYYHLLLDKKVLSDKISFNEFMIWFDLTGLQRHLKNLGIFSRLNYRDNKSHYLQDIPRVLNNILLTCEKYPFLTDLKSFLTDITSVNKVDSISC